MRRRNIKDKTPQELKRDTILRHLNEQQKKAFNCCCETDSNVFITGGAGVGKTYLLQGIITILRALYRKQVLVCAPTAMAASILEGSTIHKAFGFQIGVSATENKKFLSHAPKIIAKADVIVIDEISQVRLDTFTSIVKSIEKANKRRAKMKPIKAPVKLIVCGDFAQIPPVMDKVEKLKLDELYGFDVRSGFAFEAPEWAQCNFVNFMLTEVMRQDNAEFIEKLNALRMGDKECAKWFIDHAQKELIKDASTIFPLNKTVAGFNARAVNELKGGLIHLPASVEENEVHKDLVRKNEIQKVLEDETLCLKVGAKVMFTCNAYMNAPWLKEANIREEDRSSHFFNWQNVHRNGTQGVVKEITWNPKLNDNVGGYQILVEITDDNCEYKELWVTQREKEVYGYKINEESGELEKVVVYKVKSFPLQLCYATSIHKSQGQSFNECNIAVSGSFAHGMAYVALSRCRSIENCHIMGTIAPKDIIVDPNVFAFYQSLESSFN